MESQTNIAMSVTVPSFISPVSVDNLEPLYLPAAIRDDLERLKLGINSPLHPNRFLFVGSPGTGKTESVKHLAAELNKNLYELNVEEIVSSKLGETNKNLKRAFNQMKDCDIVLLDELDSLIYNRLDNKDISEMRRVISTFIKCLDNVLDKETVLICTTNLVGEIDKAVLRRFNKNISFDQYALSEINALASALLKEALKIDKREVPLEIFMKAFHILYANDSYRVQSPADIKNLIQTSLAFSNPKIEGDFIRYMLESHLIRYSDYEDHFTDEELKYLTKGTHAYGDYTHDYRTPYTI